MKTECKYGPLHDVFLDDNGEYGCCGCNETFEVNIKGLHPDTEALKKACKELAKTGCPLSNMKKQNFGGENEPIIANKSWCDWGKCPPENRSDPHYMCSSSSTECWEKLFRGKK